MPDCHHLLSGQERDTGYCSWQHARDHRAMSESELAAYEHTHESEPGGFTLRACRCGRLRRRCAVCRAVYCPDCSDNTTK